MSHTPSNRKSLFLNLVLLLILVFAIAYPNSSVKAANFTAGTFTELSNAISTANGNGQTDSITLTADITLTSTLPTIGSQITIEGAGFYLDGASSYRVLNVTSAGNLTVNNLIIQNGSTPSGGGGGGILNAGGILIVNYSSFSGNSATGSNPFGGAIHNSINSGSITISNSTFSNNSALSGGAIRNNGTLIINNSTISGNTAGSGYGGGITNVGGRTLTLYNNTISNNTAGSGNGGGIRNDGTLNYTNTIIANSSSGGDCSLGGSGVIGTNSYNLTEDGSCSAAYSGDPSLDTLADNGGPTMTHALLPGSGAIDVVPNGTAPNDIDQRGAGRDYDGDGSSSSNEGDIGAYELRETITQGTCGGSLLSGTQNFAFASGKTVTMVINSNTDLSCITVEEMGSAHLLGNQGIQLTDNWWLITGDGSTFDLNLTLPASFVPDDGDQVCRYTGPGTTWDCAANSFDGTTITRNNVTAFSDWATFEDETPTAISLTGFTANSTPMLQGMVVGLVVLSSLIFLRQFKIRAN